MNIFNGKYDQCLEVIISANTHEQCLNVAKKITKLCEAWGFQVRFDQYKSARKGDVLKRTFLIYQTAYSHDIIIFRESMSCLCHHYGLYTDVVMITRYTTPKQGIPGVDY